jgi:hypothetical protein
MKAVEDFLSLTAFVFSGCSELKKKYAPRTKEKITGK